MKNKILWLFKKREKILLSGDSMSPLYSNGDVLWIDPFAYKKKLPKVGENVLCRHPYEKDRWLVKRIDAIDEKGCLFLMGINKNHSTDSRSFGMISSKLLAGKVVGIARKGS